MGFAKKSAMDPIIEFRRESYTTIPPQSNWLITLGCRRGKCLLSLFATCRLSHSSKSCYKHFLAAHHHSSCGLDCAGWCTMDCWIDGLYKVTSLGRQVCPPVDTGSGCEERKRKRLSVSMLPHIMHSFIKLTLRYQSATGCTHGSFWSVSKPLLRHIAMGWFYAIHIDSSLIARNSFLESCL